MSKYELLYDRLRDVKVINTHEHLYDESWRLENPGDWTGLFFHYGISVLQVAGMTKDETTQFFDLKTPHDRKWAIFSRYFPLARNTACIKSALIAIKDIYGIDRIGSEAMRELTAKIQAAVKPGFHRKVLCEMGGIDYCLVNAFDRDENNERYPARLWGDTELLRPDLYADSFIYPAQYALLSRLTGVDSTTFDGFLKAVDVYFAKTAGQCVSIKIATAGCSTTLDFDPSASRNAAEKQFAVHVKTPLAPAAARPLMDYLFHNIVKKAAEYRLPLKFHTGLYSAANYINFVTMENNVRDLAKLAIANPQCKFIAMHIAYPFQDQLVMVTKQVTNLYADMSWMWLGDPGASADFLKNLLTAAPVTKVTGFGGDFSLVENTYGTLELTRQFMAKVLAELVEDGYMDLGEAGTVGQYLMRYSAERLYNRET